MTTESDSRSARYARKSLLPPMQPPETKRVTRSRLLALPEPNLSLDRSPLKEARTAQRNYLLHHRPQTLVQEASESDDELLLSPGKKYALPRQVDSNTTRSTSPPPQDDFGITPPEVSGGHASKNHDCETGELESRDSMEVETSGAAQNENPIAKFIPTHSRNLSEPTTMSSNPFSTGSSPKAKGKDRARSVPAFPVIDLENAPISPRRKRARSRSPTKERDSPKLQILIKTMPSILDTDEMPPPASSSTSLSDGPPVTALPLILEPPPSTPVAKTRPATIFNTPMSPLTPIPSTPPGFRTHEHIPSDLSPHPKGWDFGFETSKPIEGPPDVLDAVPPYVTPTAPAAEAVEITPDPPTNAATARKIAPSDKAGSVRVTRAVSQQSRLPRPGSSHSNHSSGTSTLLHTKAMNPPPVPKKNAFDVMMKSTARIEASKSKGKGKEKMPPGLSTSSSKLAPAPPALTHSKAISKPSLNKGKEKEKAKAGVGSSDSKRSSMKAKMRRREKPAPLPPPIQDRLPEEADGLVSTEALVVTEERLSDKSSPLAQPPADKVTAQEDETIDNSVPKVNSEPRFPDVDGVTPGSFPSSSLDAVLSSEIEQSVTPLEEIPAAEVEMKPVETPIAVDFVEDAPMDESLVADSPVVEAVVIEEAFAPVADNLVDSQPTENSPVVEKNVVEDIVVERVLEHVLAKNDDLAVDNDFSMSQDLPVSQDLSIPQDLPTAKERPRSRTGKSKAPATTADRVTRSSALKRKEIDPVTTQRTDRDHATVEKPAKKPKLSESSTGSSSSSKATFASSSKVPSFASPTKASAAKAKPKQIESSSPTKRLAKAPTFFPVVGPPAFARSFTGPPGKPSSLQTLASALEKLRAPPPERPNTSLGFSRDELEPATKHSVPAASIGLGRPSHALQRASTLASLPSSSAGPSRPRVGPSAKLAVGSGSLMRGRPGMFNRPGPKVSRNPGLPSVIGSPVKGGSLEEDSATFDPPVSLPTSSAGSMGPPEMPSTASTPAEATTEVDGMRRSTRIAQNTPAVDLPQDSQMESEPQLTVLKGCIVFVDVRSELGGDDLKDHIASKLKELGARVLGQVGQTCTHIVYKNGLPSTLSRFKQLSEPKPFVVGMDWVFRCINSLTREEERRFLVDIDDMNSIAPKRRKSMLPQLAFDHMDEGNDADRSFESSSSMVDNELTPLERARLRKAAAGHGVKPHR
ncbi:unnamed protein product [Mycena citricolor]|uniref:BRCT domain-containing protein n=1 Tax=Mycena citricolor TaxID=2018698 RepID=A0AAD2HVE6_9AGAR|nr:unnamed protein product [Mycena citricolor]